jgi:thiamine-phosphate pyrophosphorylase
MNRFLGDLHVITDETLQDRFSHAELAARVAEGGGAVVQFREKRPRTTQELVEAARRIREALADSRTSLVVNDRADVAAAVEAEGLHLGQHDLEPAVARELLGPHVVIGGTANNLAEAIAVAARGEIDYLGVGPVFGTRSKARPAPALGVEGLRRIVEAVEKPVIAIGAITAERVAEVLDAGAHGVAVLSAVVCARDPAHEAARFREAMNAWWARRKSS